jgi:glycosyltransferase involved in cell wall biosynthesis
MKPAVCYFCIATQLGGAEKSLLEFLRSAKIQPGFTGRPLLPRAEGALVNELRRAGIEFDVLPMPLAFLRVSRGTPWQSLVNLFVCMPALLRYLLALRAYLREKRVTILHTTGVKCHLIAFPATLGLPVKVIWHLRDILSFGPTLLCLRLLRRARIRVLANSRVTALSFSRRHPPKIVYNGVDTEYYRGIDRVAESVLTVGIVGVLARWKGQKEFLAMAAEIIRRGYRCRFVVVGAQIYDTAGDQGYEAELMVLVKRLKLEQLVSFTGFRADVVAVFNELDILVHASLRPEPFGRVLIEAQACGVAVVASAAGGVLEIVEPGVTGLLFQPGNVEDMADQVERLLINPMLRDRIAKRARLVVGQRFSLEAHTQQILDFYQGLDART